MWAVCGPPRSGTTAMLEAIAAWTTLSVRWNLDTEWLTRRQTGRNEAYLEMPNRHLEDLGPDAVAKILNPQACVTPTRAVLMVRDPAEIVDSARRTLGQRLDRAGVEERYAQFRARGWAIDEVRTEELERPPWLFERLGKAGWPVATYTPELTLRAQRPGW